MSLRAGLLWALGAELLGVAFAAVLTVRGVAVSAGLWGGLGISSMWVSAAVCWLAVSRVGFRRPEVLLAAAAVTSFVAGNTYSILMTPGGGSLSFPSPGDAMHLLFYPLVLAALALAVRNQVRGPGSSPWWDGVVGSLGVAAVLTVVLSPVLDSALTRLPSIGTAVMVAYPMFDLLLVGAVAGIALIQGLRMGRRWAFLVAGLLVFAAAHATYALQVTANAYVVGSLLDGAWPAGLALMALWVDSAAPRDGSSTQPEAGTATREMALVVPAVATAAALGVLVVGTRVPLSTLAVVLASATVLAAVARTQVAIGQFVPIAGLDLQTAVDELTGLPNRQALHAKGRARLVGHDSRRALLLLDLDKFKVVNESLGRYVGDRLLVQVGARLLEHMRDGDLLVRLRGDEFAVLLEDAGHEQAASVAAKLHAALAEPFALKDVVVHSGVSIGISLFPDHGRDVSTLLRKADIALNHAKTSGDGHHFYSDTDGGGGETGLDTAEELQTAMTSDQLVLHYQPKIDLDTGDVHSIEAHVRWDHPTRGLLHPDSFIALVEQSGLMRAMTQAVLELALDQATVWQRQGQHLTIAVKLSAGSLVDADLPGQVVEMLAARDLRPGVLQLEITEDFLMADRDRAQKILTRLRDGGVRISVDDFGTGHSSLAYLRGLPIDELKLGRSFVLRVVAEGADTHAAHTELLRLGCDQAQGYYMSRPVPATELDHWLSTRDATDQSLDIPQLQPVAALP
ncbi:MAG: EAL domain-containing protein [Actinomycetota bacterium]